MATSTHQEPVQLYLPGMKPPQQRAEMLLTKQQFSSKLGCTQRTIDRWLHQGILPEGIKVTIGGTVRFRETAADHWIAEGCPGATNG